MEAGIVGLPNVGKSTLFNALTAAGAEAKNYPFCTIDPNVGVVPVPDPRLETIHRYIETEKIVPAALRLVDIAGLVKGASKGEGRGNQFLSHIRQVDAVLHVVRCFEDDNITHVDGRVDPVRDIEVIELELMLADLQVVESALDKASRQARTGDKEAKQRVALLERFKQALETGRPIRSLELDENERQDLKGLGLITAKDVLYVANVDESALEEDGPLYSKVLAYAQEHGGGVVKVCAKIESELAELEGDDQAEMLESLGMDEPALALVAREAYKLLGLQSFFTAGPKEIRAWAVRAGSTAPVAAGAIHSDFERLFIRAEVYQIQDLVDHGSEAEIKAAGKLRIEGKDYLVQESDVCHFRIGK
ncbi:MAG: redox-regulated ATPase YchF [Phycisphaeraceae bacterium]|nr:redox-regulated ATPase YchF [Phycisphaeraceae bacterium]